MANIFTVIPKREKFTFTYSTLDAQEEVTKTETFWGYFRGAGCPTPIVIETDNVDVEYEDNYPTSLDADTLSDTEYMAKARRANMLKFRDTLVLVLPGMSHELANILVSPDDDGKAVGLEVLSTLGWRAIPATVDAPANEEEADESTEGNDQRVNEEIGQ